MRLHPGLLMVAATATALVASGAIAEAPIATSGPMARQDAYALAEGLADVGRQMFTDASLSASGKLACASCHDPAHAFGPPNALAVQLGGADLAEAGVRAVPSLMYLQTVPAFTEHFHEDEDEGDESVDAGPTGGLTWDGRVDRGRDQAELPLLSPFEMANRDPASVAAAVAHAPYAHQLSALYGPDLLADPVRTFTVALQALEAYQQDWRSFYPYTSKYDAYLAGKATLTAAEARGLALFNDPAKGNCAGCHISAPAANGKPPEFSDFGLIALGLPRNPAIPANADPDYHDLGLCGPQRTDLAGRSEYCGLFRTPSLRNVATRGSFFHNGVYHSLRDAVRFYALRDSDPGAIYPEAADGTVEKFDDLPLPFRGNVNSEPPFGRQAGDAPALSDAEIDDVVAFLGTLTDGYTRLP